MNVIVGLLIHVRYVQRVVDAMFWMSCVMPTLPSITRRTRIVRVIILFSSFFVASSTISDFGGHISILHTYVNVPSDQTRIFVSGIVHFKIWRRFTRFLQWGDGMGTCVYWVDFVSLRCVKFFCYCFVLPSSSAHIFTKITRTYQLVLLCQVLSPGPSSASPFTFQLTLRAIFERQLA